MITTSSSSKSKTTGQVEKTAYSGGNRVALNRRDIIFFEQRLKDAVQEFFPCDGYSLHFPRTLEPRKLEWRKEEDQLLLPLPAPSSDAQDLPSTLAVFVARGVPADKVDNLGPYWDSLGKAITGNLLLYKQSICDPVTTLFSRHYLLESLGKDIESINYSLPMQQSSNSAIDEDAPGKSGKGKKNGKRGKAKAEAPLDGTGLFASGNEIQRRSSIGTLVIRFAGLRDIVREFGYQFADELMIALAEALVPLCPEQSLPARIGDYEFALHLPAATSKQCQKLGEDIAAALKSVRITHPLRRELVGTKPAVGFTLYPQDMGGEAFMRPAQEQARIVLRKARLAAALANEERPLLSSRQDGERVLAFSRILAEGGQVLEVLPLSRVMVSLGGSMHAREGQRFSVWSIQYPVQGMGDKSGASGQMPPLYKGEIVLMEVMENSSQAEIVNLGDPSWEISPGDRLILLPEEQSRAAAAGDASTRFDPESGLLRHGDFFSRWAEARDSCESFVMALIRLGEPLDAGQREDDEERGKGAPYTGIDMAKAARICREVLGSSPLGGRYGLNSLIFFQPDVDPEAALLQYKAIAGELEKELGHEVSIGLASHPYLNFRKPDVPENCRKALEYAMLLPSPHVGLLDTLALNISADKMFSHGDVFGAIKEYQLAILADEKNGMAWNSLGICMAGLDRDSEAMQLFNKALECDENDLMALYNLGYIHQSKGRYEEAREYYENCIKNAPEHLFSLLRLGQLAEHRGDLAEAGTLYSRAAALPGGKGPTCRHFARLCLSEGKEAEAREHLHEALIYDPQDAVSLQLLAKLYLDAGEDPELAAGLARQSVSLLPGLKGGWLELARALEVMGEEQQAKEARLRAGDV